VRIDLHCHSTASDGEYPPAEVVRRAGAASLSAMALTDHDTLAGVPEALAEGDRIGVRVIAGCEFSVKAPWGEMHLLGYFLPPQDARLETFLCETRAARVRRGEQMVERLRKLGVTIDLEDVRAAAGGGAVGRPHVARALVARGASTDISDAFDRYLGRGRPGYVAKPLPTLQRVTQLIHEVGGLAVAAHLGERGSEPQVREFRAQGLDGLEVRHPSHSSSDEIRLQKLADKLGMVVSGGSDWHGDSEFGHHGASLGELDVPLEWLEGMERRRGEAYV
jgi:predicted metal-dependent phosphoesterase TrpH